MGNSIYNKTEFWLDDILYRTLSAFDVILYFITEQFVQCQLCSGSILLIALISLIFVLFVCRFVL